MSFEWNIERFDKVGSTQELVRDRASLGIPEGLVVVAASQSAGHGRHGREWISEVGNLYFSMLLKPECKADDLGQLSLLIGLALGEALQEALLDAAQIRLKWPNDVLVDDKKCAGILVEAELNGSDVEWIVIGIGVDIAHAPEDVAVSLNNYAPQPLEIEELLRSVLEKIKYYYVLWMGQGFEDIRRKWSSLAHKKGSSVSVRIGAREEHGSFYGIDERGCLLLHDGRGTLKTISSGDVILCS